MSIRIRLESPDRWATLSERDEPLAGRFRHIVVDGASTSACGVTALPATQWKTNKRKPRCPDCVEDYANWGRGETPHKAKKRPSRSKKIKEKKVAHIKSSELHEISESLDAARDNLTGFAEIKSAVIEVKTETAVVTATWVSGEWDLEIA